MIYMTLTELEQAVLTIIEEVYCKKYVGKIKIKEILDCNKKVIGYNLWLGLNNIERPLTIQKEGTQDEFLKYIRRNLSSRHLNDVFFYSGYQLPPKDDCTNSKCSCNG